MKRTIIISGVVVVIASIVLIILNNILSKKTDEGLFAEVETGTFELTVTATGEIQAERSVDIMAPEMIERGGGGGPHGGGGDIRVAPLRIQDLVPEGTMVKQGDFIAQLDRTEYDNNLKDDRERLTNLQSNLDMKLLDTAVVLNSLRDDIKNQRYLVSEAELKLKNSKYEAPDVIRQAEISLDKARRNLEQKLRYYTLRVAQVNQEIRNTTFYIDRVNSRILSIEDLLRQFTVLAPSEGMVIYKRDFRGSKRKVGTMISPFDRVVATIPDLSSMISRTFISEIEVNKVKPGQKVDITIDALPLKQFKGTVISVANIGEVLPNTDTKVFETMIKLEMSDPALRPSMTSGNKILVREIENAVFVPTESIFSGPDSIPYVYTRNRLRQIVIPGVSNDKLTVIEKGLKAGSFVYLAEPENHDRIRLAGKELIEEIRQRNKAVLKLSGR